MPKFNGENTKAVAARARKKAAKEEEEFRKQKEKEDEYWRDDDKLINKKLQRKEQQEKKKLEQIQRKAELKNLVQQEEKALKSLVKTQKTPSKTSRAQIQEEREKRNAAASLAAKKKDTLTHIEKPLEENINRIKVDGLEARSVTEAISILSVKEPEEDKNPHKRMKAAYASFEAANLPRLKEENPTLRLSQLKQLLFKQWSKSPENPLNQQLKQ